MGKLKISKKKHKPIRTCIVTREKKPKKELIRLVVDKDGMVKVDPKGKIRGRGANILPEMETLEKGFEINAIKRALKLKSALSDADKDRIRKDFKEAIEEKSFRPTNKPVKIRVKKQELEKKVNGGK
ncbi:DUF448 domain-containing protein [Candidatus Dojkabacteria bacterium]|nr:DUF448 domain-containing protein [Candidatus Dojkabacteria bacterium]